MLFRILPALLFLTAVAATITACSDENDHHTLQIDGALESVEIGHDQFLALQAHKRTSDCSGFRFDSPCPTVGEADFVPELRRLACLNGGCDAVAVKLDDIPEAKRPPPEQRRPSTVYVKVTPRQRRATLEVVAAFDETSVVRSVSLYALEAIALDFEPTWTLYREAVSLLAGEQKDKDEKEKVNPGIRALVGTELVLPCPKVTMISDAGYGGTGSETTTQTDSAEASELEVEVIGGAVTIGAISKTSCDDWLRVRGAASGDSRILVKRGPVKGELPIHIEAAESVSKIDLYNATQPAYPSINDKENKRKPASEVLWRGKIDTYESFTCIATLANGLRGLGGCRNIVPNAESGLVTASTPTGLGDVFLTLKWKEPPQTGGEIAGTLGLATIKLPVRR